MYRQIIHCLISMGYIHHQYSDYSCDTTTALLTLTVMLGLRWIRPPVKLATTLKGVKMHFISDNSIWNMTEGMQLGGRWFRACMMLYLAIYSVTLDRISISPDRSANALRARRFECLNTKDLQLLKHTCRYGCTSCAHARDEKTCGCIQAGFEDDWM